MLQSAIQICVPLTMASKLSKFCPVAEDLFALILTCYENVFYFQHLFLFIQDIKPVIDGMDGIKISQGLGLQDFDLIRVIGRGSYAKVLLVRLKKNDQIYAMKVVKKELVHDDEVKVCINCIVTYCKKLVCFNKKHAIKKAAKVLDSSSMQKFYDF